MSASRPSRLWIWFCWLAGFYAVWLALVLVGDHAQTLREHWGIAAAMAAGSYVAGSTPMGGGTVGFPILVLLFHQSAELGRDFSFAVQSIGMVSAAIFIISRRQRLEWTMLGGAAAGSLIGTPLGIFFVAPHIPGLLIKIVFAVIWASFGVLHLYRTREFAAAEGLAPINRAFDWRAGFGVGLFAGLTMVSITGVGIDMMIYAVLVLLRRADLKIAIPTSVVIMAFNSVLGVLTKNLTTGLMPGVYENWLAAAPIVALGAPLGVFVVHLIGRAPTLYFVSVLCIGQFFWTMQDEWEHIGVRGLIFAVLGVAVFNLAFEALYRFGRRKKRPFARSAAVEAAGPVAVDAEAP
jgi:uncharacterized membrane protein YfcA